MGASSRTLAHQDTLELATGRLLDAFEAAIPGACEQGASAICTEITAYQRIADAKLIADIRATMAANLTAMADALRNHRQTSSEDLRFLRAPTTRRLQKRLALADVLQGYRIGHRIAWETLASCADDDETKDAAFALAGPLIEYLNSISTHVTEVYIEVEQLLIAEGERVRRDLLEELLNGYEPPPGPRTEALRASGLQGDATYVVVSALPIRPPSDEHLPRAAVKALGDLAGASAPLAVQRGDEIVAVIPVARQRAAKFAGQLQAVRTKLADLGIELSIGSSTVVPGLQRLAAAYREATDARALSGNRRLLCLCQVSVFDYLAMRGDETAARLVSPELASFVETDLAEGGVLTTTFLEYAAVNLNAKAAAEHLGIHVNTAHHRLARIAERTGLDLKSLDTVIEILIAIKMAQRSAISTA
jgi:hypothetical protein